MTSRERRRRKIEKQIAKAQAAYNKTRSIIWLARLRDLTTQALALT